VIPLLPCIEVVLGLNPDHPYRGSWYRGDAVGLYLGDTGLILGQIATILTEVSEGVSLIFSGEYTHTYRNQLSDDEHK
jgi:hypothetical protein